MSAKCSKVSDCERVELGREGRRGVKLPAAQEKPGTFELFTPSFGVSTRRRGDRRRFVSLQNLVRKHRDYFATGVTDS